MEWKPIKHYEGRYEVSKEGYVRSTKRNIILAKRYNTTRYLHVALYFGGVREDRLTHRLVALHWKKKPVGDYVVDHKDRNKLNNHVDNLEWVTSSENTKRYHDNRRKSRKTRL